MDDRAVCGAHRTLTKRHASPGVLHGHTRHERSVAVKRCRQLMPGQHILMWESGVPTSKARQLSSQLRRVQSAPIGATATLHQQTLDDLEHWRSREEANRPLPDRIASVQREVTFSMRRVLVDWLGEVRDEFRLHSETLHLAVGYLDRFLERKPASRQRFQLLGLACLWVAAKFEEVYPPPLGAMLAMAENSYSPADMLAMEKEVLFTLDFQLSAPTALRFLLYLLQLSHLPPHPDAALSARRLAEAVLELSLLEGGFRAAPPSHVAAAAVYLALGLVGHGEGLPALLALSGAPPGELGGLVQDLATLLHHEAAQEAPCALLSRYAAWEGLHGRQAREGHATGAAGEQLQAQHAPPPPVFQQQAAVFFAAAVHAAEPPQLRTPPHHAAAAAAAQQQQQAPTPGQLAAARSPLSALRSSPLERCVINLSALSSLSLAPTAQCC